MLSVLSFLSGALSLISKVWGWVTTRSEQKAGADAQSAQDVVVAEPVEAGEVQAVMDAPKTKADALARLKDGTA